MSPAVRFVFDDVSPAPLAEPIHFEFSGKTAPNRFLKAALSEALASFDEDKHNIDAIGVPSKELIHLYKLWGEGQAGVILTGNIQIDPRYLETKGNMVIPTAAPFSGERFEAFKALATEAKKHGSLIVAQVNNPGRQVSKAWNSNPMSASDVELPPRMGIEFAKPHPATEEEIQHVIEGFAHSAEYLYKAGYDGIELHGAHGYLIAQFLSRSTNLRTDSYGGSLENRARLILEIGRAVRARVPKDFILSTKINAIEFQEKGFTAEDCRDVCVMLEKEGFDFVELSGGTYYELAFHHRDEKTRKREAYFIEFAETIAPALKRTKVYCSGGFRTVGGMVSALSIIDGIGLGRPVCQEPFLTRDILEGKVKGTVKWALAEDDTFMTTSAGTYQMHQLAKGEEAIDVSNEKVAREFKARLGEEPGKANRH